MRNSPLKDAKFLTNLQPAATDPKRLIKMTPEERVEARDALGKSVEAGLTFQSGVGLITKGYRALKFGVTAVKNSGTVANVFNLMRKGIFGGAKNIVTAGAKGKIKSAVIGSVTSK